MSIALRLSAVTVFALLPLAAKAQQPDPVPTVSTHDGKVYLDIVASGKGGQPLAELEQQDFTILDNKAPQTIESFQALGGDRAPVEVILVIDAVNAGFTTVASERGQIDKFLRANGGHLPYPTTMAFLNDTGTEIEDGFTTDGNALSAALDNYTTGLRTIRRSAGIYGADERVSLSLKTLRQLAVRESSRPGRKIVLWISPGWPLLSGPAIQLSFNQQKQIFGSVVDLSDQLRNARITLYAVDPLGAEESLSRDLYYQAFLDGVVKPRDVNIGNLALQVFAAQTGGLVINSNDVTEMLQRSMRDTTAYYEITYKPGPAEHLDEYHHIQVQIARPGVTARTLRGYYAQP